MAAERRGELNAELSALEACCAAAAERVLELHGERIDSYRAEVATGLGEALAELRRSVREVSGADPLTVDLAEQLTGYVEWLQWTFWDLPAFAVALDPPAESFREAVADCGLVYLSLRLLDDVLDRHFCYRGERSTLLATLAEEHTTDRRAEGLTVLGAFLLCLEGITRLGGRLGRAETAEASGEALSRLMAVLEGARRAVLGALLEHSPAANWDKAYYSRLVELKNVDYQRCLWAALDPSFASPLYPFLCDSYAVAQKLNDLDDHAADESRGQPNLLSILRREHGTLGGALAAARAEIGADFLRLGESAERLPRVERGLALAKLGEHFEEARRLGLFTESAPAPAASQSLATGIGGDSTLEEVVAAAGPEALVSGDCPVCGCREHSLLLRCRGFAIERCADCGHCFVDPWLSPTLRERLAQEQQTAGDDPFLDAQRMWAGYVCRLLQREAPGARLLDVGFGLGTLLRMAHAYGFEVYGVERDAHHLAALGPYFGARLARASADGSLPWGSFHAVVVSHVLEHLADPGRLLAEVYGALVPGGVVYLAVPDVESLQLQVFGRRWSVVNPIVHGQYFSQGSLWRLLEERGFTALERLEAPPLVGAVPRWMRLLRQLGGTESGELAMLARRPLDEPGE